MQFIINSYSGGVTDRQRWRLVSVKTIYFDLDFAIFLIFR